MKQFLYGVSVAVSYLRVRFSPTLFCIFHCVSVESIYIFFSSFWGLRHQTPTGALPLDPAGTSSYPISKFLATPLLNC